MHNGRNNKHLNNFKNTALELAVSEATWVLVKFSNLTILEHQFKEL